MRKETVFKNYAFGSEIEFNSLPKAIAAKLYAFAAVSSIGDTIKINRVPYVLDYISVNGKYDCVSVYFRSRNRLVRVSDHWSAIQRGFASKNTMPLKGIGKVAACWWRLVGADQSFIAPCQITHGKTLYTRDEYGYVESRFVETTISANRKIEGGWVSLRNIKLYDNNLI